MHWLVLVVMALSLCGAGCPQPEPPLLPKPPSPTKPNAVAFTPTRRADVID